MWKDFSRSYLKNNRGTAVTILSAVFTGALFLSLLLNLFYNLWVYEIEKIEREEGAWHARIFSEIGEDEEQLLYQFANIEKVVTKKEAANDAEVTELYFRDMRKAYADLPLIMQRLGLGDEETEYHELLLSRYLINDPQDPEPPLLLPFYLLVLAMVSGSLVLIIRNSFELSMNARIHQFGILASVGATPGQLRRALFEEAAALSILPVFAGTAAGTGLGFLAVKASNHFLGNIPGRQEAVFNLHPAVLLSAVLASFLTVLLSAWIPAVKIGKMAPLEAIRGTKKTKSRRKRRPGIFFRLFGIEGELAGNSLKAYKKQTMISGISLQLSFLGFSLLFCFFALSGISTRYTYFERYQDAWDVMASVPDAALDDLSMIEELKKIPGAADTVCYQKEKLKVRITENMQSEQLQALGGVWKLSGKTEIEAPVVVLDDESFLNYCEKSGVTPSLDGVLVLNSIWDSVHSNFRDRKNIPYLKETTKTLCFEAESGAVKEIPVTGFVQKPPLLREEYTDYGLVQFMPLSLWKTFSQNPAEKEVFVRVLIEDRTNPDSFYQTESALGELLGTAFEASTENRIQEKISNDEMIFGAKMILGAFCVLLAAIGIANVLGTTMGFLRQRKREFAQYLSIGMSPENMRKMFCIEAAVTAGKPVLLTLVLTAAAAELMLWASHLERSVFWKEAPVMPILLFAAAILFFVALAYYIGARRLLRCDLSGVLKDDTLM